MNRVANGRLWIARRSSVATADTAVHEPADAAEQAVSARRAPRAAQRLPPDMAVSDRGRTGR